MSALPPDSNDPTSAGAESIPDDTGSEPGRIRRFRTRHRARRHGRSKLRRRLERTGIVVAVLVVVLVGVPVGYTAYRNAQIVHVTVRNLKPVAKSGIEDILLIGSTQRCPPGEKNDQTGALGSCAAGQTGINSDVVMVLRLDPANRSAKILSIPRDDFIPNARPGESNRIDSALVYGPSQLVSAVENDFGIPINHYVELNFFSFEAIVHSLGGMKIYFPAALKDADSSLSQPKTGCVKIGAFEALAIVRARHLYYKVGNTWVYDPTGDIGRIIRVHEFLRVLASDVAKRGLGNPIADNSLIGDLAPDLTVDTSFSALHMGSLAYTFHSLDPNDVIETTVPVVEDPNTYYYQGFSYGDIVFPSEPQDSQAIAAFLGSKPAGSDLAASSVSVSIDGGIGDPTATATTAAALRADGFHVVGTAETTPVGPIRETEVVYATPADRPLAQRVLGSLAGTVALGQGKTIDGAPVMVITGSNFTVVHASGPAHSGVPATSGVSAATTTSVTTSRAVTTSFGAATLLAAGTAGTTLPPPTAASVKLPSYDPRACPVRKKK